jgi:hypothetical protein
MRMCVLHTAFDVEQRTSAEPPVRLAGPWYLRNSSGAIWLR